MARTRQTARSSINISNIYKLYFIRRCGAGCCTSQKPTIEEYEYYSHNMGKFLSIVREILEDREIYPEAGDYDVSNMKVYEEMLRDQDPDHDIEFSIKKIDLL